MSIVLPIKKVKVTRLNPKRIVIYGKPKVGKSTALAGLENNLIVDLENGSDFIEAIKYKVNNLQELLDLGKEIRNQGNPYKFISIDTVSVLEDMVLPLALKLYKNTPLGKNFEGDSVLTLPQGAGYMYIRLAFFQVLDFIDTLAETVILCGHTKDAQVNDKGELVLAANIDLTGKIKNLLCASSDAIGYMMRKEGKTILSFKTSEEVNCGARPLHLGDKDFIITEVVDGILTTNWDQIFK